MNILFLTQFYWPEETTAPKNLASLAESLQTKGHEVTVITAFPNYPLGKIYENYDMKLWSWEERNGVKILRLPLYPNHSLSFFRRFLSFSSFALSLSTIGLSQSFSKKADIVFSYLDPITIGLPAFLFKVFLDAPVVYWLTDMWPEVFETLDKEVPPFVSSLVESFGRWVYRHSNVICVNSPGYKKNLIKKGVSANKIEVVMDWAEERMFSPVEPKKELAQKFGLADHFNVMYGGNLGVLQGLDTVIEAARKLQDYEDIQFVFIGDGNDEERLKRMADEYSLENVLFIPRQPMNEIHKFFALADVLLVHLQPKTLFKIQVPSKIMAYLACGRPILGAVEGSAAEVIRDSKAGLICSPGNPEKIASKVLDFFQMPENKRKEMGKQARKSYQDKYTREVRVKQVEEILKETIKNYNSDKDRK